MQAAAQSLKAQASCCCSFCAACKQSPALAAQPAAKLQPFEACPFWQQIESEPWQQAESERETEVQLVAGWHQQTLVLLHCLIPLELHPCSWTPFWLAALPPAKAACSDLPCQPCPSVAVKTSWCQQGARLFVARLTSRALCCNVTAACWDLPFQHASCCFYKRWPTLLTRSMAHKPFLRTSVLPFTRKSTKAPTPLHTQLNFAQQSQLGLASLS